MHLAYLKFLRTLNYESPYATWTWKKSQKQDGPEQK